MEAAKNSADDVVVAAKNVGNFGSSDALRKAVADIRARLGESKPTVVALAGEAEGGKAVIIVAANEAARNNGIKAGDLARTASKMLGGGGGGKPDMAQGGGVDVTKIDEALDGLSVQAQGR